MATKGFRLKFNRETRQLEHLDPAIRALSEARRKEEAEPTFKPLFDLDLPHLDPAYWAILEECKDLPRDLVPKSESEFSGFSDSDLEDTSSRPLSEIYEQ